MEKYILYIRHAKSQWGDMSLPDIERPLNERGMANAPLMAHRLSKIIPNTRIAIRCSPATRAKQTAEYFIRELSVAQDDIEIVRSLYYGDEEDYFRCLENLSEDITVVLIFGHNPTLEFVGTMLRPAFIGPIPTCGILLCTTNSKWNALEPKNITFLQCLIPKDHKNNE